MWRQIDRQECKYGYQCSSQQWHGSGSGCIDYGDALTHTALHVYECSVVNHYGVVHQHTHGNDDCRQRHTLQSYSRGLHIYKCTENGEYKSATYQETVFQSDEEKQYRHYGYDRYYEVRNEAVISHIRFVSLVVEDIYLETFGK